MKKSVAVLIAVVTLIAFAGCGENGTPKDITSELPQDSAYEKYENAVRAVNAADSFSGDIILRTAMSIEGEPYEYDVTTGLKHVFGSGNNFQAELIADVDQELDYIYYKDGTFYFASGSEKLKFDSSGEEFLKMTNSRIVTEVVFPRSDIFGYEATEDKDGTDFRFEVYSTGMENILREIADYSVTGGISEHDEENLNYSFEDVVVNLRLDRDGKMKKIQLAFILVIYHMGDAVESYIELAMDISQIGGVVIEFPDDLDSYIAMQ